MADESLLVSAPHWDWSASNGSATAAQTAAAYTALTTGGRTSAFSAAVWNDILSKISAQRLDWGDTAWNEKIAKLADTKMSGGMGMTADKFNSAVINIPISNYVWPWEASLGRSAIKKGDRCYGMYFVYLTDGINHWIDLVPVPIDIVADFHTVSGMDSHVLKALHVLPAKPVSHKLKNVVTVNVPTGIPVCIESTAYQTGRAFMEFLYTMEVRIAHFMRYRPELGVTMYPTAHVIINNGMSLTTRASFSYNNALYLLFALRATLTQSGNVKSALSFPIRINTEIGSMTGKAALSASQLIDFAFNLDVTVGGEPWIREAFAEPMQVVLDVSVPIGSKVSYDDTNIIKTLLEAAASESIRVTSHNAEIARAVLKATLQSKIGVYGASPNIVKANSNIDFQSRLAVSLGVRSYLRGVLSYGFSTIPGVTVHRTDVVKTLLKGTVESGVKFRAQDALFVKALLEAVVSESIGIKKAPAQHAKAVSAFLAAVKTKVLTDKAQHVISDLLQLYKLKPGVSVKDSLPFIPIMLSKSALSGTTSIKPTGYVAAKVDGRYALRAKIHTMNGTHTGAAFTLSALIGAVAHVFDASHMGASLQNQLAMQTKAVVRKGVVFSSKMCGQYGSTGKSVLTKPTYFAPALSALSDHLTVKTTGTVAKLDPRRTKATLSAVSDGLSTATLAHFICLSANARSTYAGSGALTLREQLSISLHTAIEYSSFAALTDVSAEYVKFATETVYNAVLTFSTTPSVLVDGALSVIQTGTVNISIVGPTLATDLDDILASNLDNTLVTEIEFRL